MNGLGINTASEAFLSYSKNQREEEGGSVPETRVCEDGISTSIDTEGMEGEMPETAVRASAHSSDSLPPVKVD